MHTSTDAFNFKNTSNMVAERMVGALRQFTTELDAATESLKLAINKLNDFIEGTQTQFTDSATDVPVAQQRQIPTLQTAQNTAQTL